MKVGSTLLGHQDLCYQSPGFLRDGAGLREPEVQALDGRGVIFRPLLWLEWKDPKQHLDKQNAEAPDVCAEIIVLLTHHLVRIVAGCASSPLMPS